MKLTARMTALVAACVFTAPSAQAIDITGAGASFPAPLYASWSSSYYKATGFRVNYQSVVSGAGVRQIKAKTVVFGASDKPLKPAALKKAGLIQFPTVIGGVVPVVNLPGIKPGQLRLTGPVLAAIYMRKITKWNDRRIKALNPRLRLPKTAITPVRRADSSGTTFIFSDYLAKVSKSWKEKMGIGKTIKWAPGLIGGKGNEGVTQFVKLFKGRIGYVSYAYAKQNKLTHVAMQNADGIYVQPSVKNFMASAANVDWKKAAFGATLTNKTGARAWPISGATFILVYRNPKNPREVRQALDFFDWAYSSVGDISALKLDYVPMPDSVVRQVKESWTRIKSPNGRSVWY